MAGPGESGGQPTGTVGVPLLATTPAEKAAALAAIEAAQERIETETRKAESQIALRKAEEMLANATTEEERQVGLTMLEFTSNCVVIHL